MARTALDGTPAQTVGDLPQLGAEAPGFALVGADLREFTRADVPGRVVLNIFPSVGTGVCQSSARHFNALAGGLDGVTVVNVSMDLPFAAAAFCAAEGLTDVVVGSAFRSTFGDDYGVRLLDSAFEGLLARAVVVLEADGTVLHTELVDDIGHEPDYDAVLAALA